MCEKEIQSVSERDIQSENGREIQRVRVRQIRYHSMEHITALFHLNGPHLRQLWDKHAACHTDTTRCLPHRHDTLPATQTRHPACHTDTTRCLPHRHDTLPPTLGYGECRPGKCSYLAFGSDLPTETLHNLTVANNLLF